MFITVQWIQLLMRQTLHTTPQQCRDDLTNLINVNKQIHKNEKRKKKKKKTKNTDTETVNG